MKKVLFFCMLLSSFAFVACGDEDEPTPTLIVSTSEVDFGAEADEKTVDVTSNTTWTVTSVAADDWCTVTPSSGTNNGQIVIKTTANPEMKERSTTVTVKSSILDVPIERTITVTQESASLEGLMVGKWEIIDQTGPEPAFDVMKGITFEFNEDKTAVAVIERILTPALPEIGTLEGTWSVFAMILTLSSEIMPGVPIVISCNIGAINADAFTCTMYTNLPGLLPSDGLPLVVQKIQ